LWTGGNLPGTVCIVVSYSAPAGGKGLGDGCAITTASLLCLISVRR
jgi:hypothetical protein